MKWLRKVIVIAVVCVALYFSGTTALAQCAMCKATAESSPELAGKLNAGILYLLSAPYVIVGTFAALIYRAYQQQKRLKERQ